MSGLSTSARRKIANIHIRHLEKIDDEVCAVKDGKFRYLQTPKHKKLYTLIRRLNVDKKNMDSEVFSIGFPPEKPKNVAAVKIIPIMGEKHDKMILREILILKACTRLFMSGVSPNLPLYYGDFLCSSSDITLYENPNITSRYSQHRNLTEMEEKISESLKNTVATENDKIYRGLFSALTEVRDLLSKSPITMKSRVIVNEFSNGDITVLYKIFAKINKHTSKTIDILSITKNVMFQILVGIRIMHNRIKIAHNDTHTSNFLFSFNTVGKILNYIIDSKKYTLRDSLYIIKIWDFGRVVAERDKNIEKRLTDTAAKLYLKINSRHDPFTALKLIDIYRAALSLQRLIIDVMPSEKSTISFLGKNFIKPLERELASPKLSTTPTSLINSIFDEFSVTNISSGEIWTI